MFNLDPCMDLAEFHRKELRLSASCPLKAIQTGQGLPMWYHVQTARCLLLTFNTKGEDAPLHGATQFE